MQMSRREQAVGHKFLKVLEKFLGSLQPHLPGSCPVRNEGSVCGHLQPTQCWPVPALQGSPAGFGMWECPSAASLGTGTVLRKGLHREAPALCSCWEPLKRQEGIFSGRDTGQCPTHLESIAVR